MDTANKKHVTICRSDHFDKIKFSKDPRHVFSPNIQNKYITRNDNLNSNFLNQHKFSTKIPEINLEKLIQSNINTNTLTISHTDSNLNNFYVSTNNINTIETTPTQNLSSLNNSYKSISNKNNCSNTIKNKTNIGVFNNYYYNNYLLNSTIKNITNFNKNVRNNKNNQKAHVGSQTKQINSSKNLKEYKNIRNFIAHLEILTALILKKFFSIFVNKITYKIKNNSIEVKKINSRNKSNKIFKLKTPIYKSKSEVFKELISNIYIPKKISNDHHKIKTPIKELNIKFKKKYESNINTNQYSEIIFENNTTKNINNTNNIVDNLIKKIIIKNTQKNNLDSNYPLAKVIKNISTNDRRLFVYIQYYYLNNYVPKNNFDSKNIIPCFDTKIFIVNNKIFLFKNNLKSHHVKSNSNIYSFDNDYSSKKKSKKINVKKSKKTKNNCILFIQKLNKILKNNYFYYYKNNLNKNKNKAKIKPKNIKFMTHKKLTNTPLRKLSYNKNFTLKQHRRVHSTVFPNNFIKNVTLNTINDNNNTINNAISSRNKLETIA